MTQVPAKRSIPEKQGGAFFPRLFSKVFRLVVPSALFFAAISPSLEATDYIPNANLNLSGSVTVVETNERTAFNADPDGGTPATD